MKQDQQPPTTIPMRATSRIAQPASGSVKQEQPPATIEPVKLRSDEWEGWSDQQLFDYEERLYDREVDGEDTWFERDQVLWEINRRRRANTR